MKEFLLTKATLTLWRVRLCVVGGAVLAAAVILLLVSPLFVLLVAADIILLLFLFFFYLPRYHRSYKITVGLHYIKVKRGIVIETESIMPFSAVISVSFLQTPGCRVLGICETSLFAAKNHIFVAALPITLAEEIKKAASG